MRIESSTSYRTSDLSLAATLVCVGFSIEAIDRTNSHRAEFVFERQEQLDNVLSGFWSGSLTIAPRSYFQALREVKARLYGQP